MIQLICFFTIFCLFFSFGYNISLKTCNYKHAPDSNIIRKIKFYDKNKNEYYYLEPYLI